MLEPNFFFFFFAGGFLSEPEEPLLSLEPEVVTQSPLATVPPSPVLGVVVFVIFAGGPLPLPTQHALSFPPGSADGTPSLTRARLFRIAGMRG